MSNLASIMDSQDEAGDFEIDVDASKLTLDETHDNIWRKYAPEPDTRFMNYEPSFENEQIRHQTDIQNPRQPPLQSSNSTITNSIRSFDNRPQTNTPLDLKRKDGPALSPTVALKRQKLGNLAEKEAHRKAAMLLYEDYLIRGGVSMAGVTMSAESFISALPNAFWEAEEPQLVTLQTVQSHIAAVEAESNTHIATGAVIETEAPDEPPTDAVSFMSWAKKEIVGYSALDAKRLGLAVILYKKPTMKRAGLENALLILRAHLQRLNAELKSAKDLHNSVSKAGDTAGDISRIFENGARKLEKKRDDFDERLKALQAGTAA